MKLTNLFKSLFKKDKKQKTLGLALGSGGARGMALIGALKAFEEENISFDIISGCSIGSIVGGMYASGYNTNQMLGFLREYYLQDFKRLIVLKLKGFTVQKLLDNMLGGMVFEDLKKPFYAVATDLYSGEQVVMESGDLANAMACSSAIPPYFKPVDRDGRKLIDGALVNSLPADVCREKGADMVISISITEEPMNEHTKNVLDQNYKGHGVQLCDRLTRGLKASDYVIEPDMSAYGFASIGEFDSMYMKGYEETKKVMPEVKALLEKNKMLKTGKSK